MNTNRFGGLLLGLLVALVTVAVAAGGVGLTPTVAPSGISAGATPTTAIAAISQTAKRSTPERSGVDPALSSPTSTRSSIASPTVVPHALGPTPTPNILLSPTPTLPYSSTPTPVMNTGQVIGHSVQGRLIVAHRIGAGPIKVVLVGDIHGGPEANTHVLAQQLLAHFQAHPDEVPASASLWVIPTMNPDGLATGHRWNAHDVDLNRNADTDLDGCAGNDWSPDTVGHEGLHPGAGGAYPFSEPETRAVRDFLGDAWVAVFYHSAAEAIFADTCQRHAPTARLAKLLSAATGYPVPSEGWTSYPITGEFGDYLAGEGVAAITVELSDHEDPEFERNLEGVRAILASVGEIASEEAIQVGAEYVWLDEGRTGVWRYAENSFIHPIALEVLSDTAYLLDGGRVLSLDLAQPTAPRLLLAPGDDVEGTRVLEPLDLATDGTSLLVLDRAGDVYRYAQAIPSEYDPAATADAWTVERYDRPVRDTYDHYFVALAADRQNGYLLETTHEQVWRFAGGGMGLAWVKLPQGRDVDLSVRSSFVDWVYVLHRAMNGPMADLSCYRDTGRNDAFQPNVRIMHPRQVRATDTAACILDRAGRRLLALDWKSGALLALYQFTDRRSVSAFWANPSGERLTHSASPRGATLILAGRDALYFYGEPERQATIVGGPVLHGPQSHDLALLDSLRGLQMPIEGAHITSRDFQMPSAPRHYRLGVHEGMDFYEHTVGVPVNRRTPVRAVADGIVIRALLGYQPITTAQADAWYAQCHSLGYTPPDVLDGYRGMQVWIDHGIIAGGGGSVVSRYAHLSAIAPGVVEGTHVARGQVIGTAGNSGTPDSLRSETYDRHLHLELWVGDHYVGQFLRPIEARDWLERILR